MCRKVPSQKKTSVLTKCETSIFNLQVREHWLGAKFEPHLYSTVVFGFSHGTNHQYQIRLIAVIHRVVACKNHKLNCLYNLTTLNDLVTNSRFPTRLHFPLRYISLLKKTFVQAYDKLAPYQGEIFLVVSCYLYHHPSSVLGGVGPAYWSGVTFSFRSLCNMTLYIHLLAHSLGHLSVHSITQILIIPLKT